jgi:hypothetical protein
VQLSPASRRLAASTSAGAVSVGSVAVTRVILVSDSHLSAAAPETAENWAAVAGYIAAAAPDLVVHLGDLSMNGAAGPADLRFARAQLDLLGVPWAAVPGNHDVGDNRLPGRDDEVTIDEPRRQRWLDVIGSDWWSLSLDGWRLLALDAQLPGSGLAAEAEQWCWLEDQLSGLGPDERVALISHKPVAPREAELACAPPYRFWPGPARHRLTRLLAGRAPALVLSGHVHQRRQLRIDQTDHLWVPTTWATLPDHVQQALGSKRAGIVAVEFAAGQQPQPAFVEPRGITQLTITLDIPDPYLRH